MATFVGTWKRTKISKILGSLISTNGRYLKPLCRKPTNRKSKALAALKKQLKHYQ
jgi:hypothetical protein